MRLFISIDPPLEQQRQISKLMQQVGLATLKPTPMEHLHFTLAFLGEQPPQKLEEIEQTIAGLEIPPMQLRCEGINWFRSGVIWLRVEPDKSLISFQKKLCHQLRNTGIQLDSRKYIPHITLFRCKRKLQARQLEQVSKVFSGFSFSFTVDHLLLKKSQLTPEGAKHTVLTEFQPGSEGSNE